MQLTHSMKKKTNDHRLSLQMTKKFLSLEKLRKLKGKKQKINSRIRKSGTKILLPQEHHFVE
jgi:hypothetical protein